MGFGNTGRRSRECRNKARLSGGVEGSGGLPVTAQPFCLPMGRTRVEHSQPWGSALLE